MPDARIHRTAVAFALTLCCLASQAWAVPARTVQSCLALNPDDKMARLDCYDELAKVAKTEPPPDPDTIEIANKPQPPSRRTVAQSGRARLARDWNLVSARHEGFDIQPYRLNYLLFANITDRINRAPSSPAPGHAVLTPEELDSTEVKFQFSIKTQLYAEDGIDFLGFDKYRPWFAYTQQSVWQAYNQRNSTPFRDSNYEPEIILTLARPDDAAFFPAFRFFNVGCAHQSNGQSEPKSRSWWRIYGQARFAFGDFTLLAQA